MTPRRLIRPVGSGPIGQAALRALAVAAACTLSAVPARAHPHVFVDGGVDLRFGQNARLETLEVTWLYDEFETLYILSSYGLELNDQGTLDEADRQELVRLRSDWPDDFDGSAHLSVDGAPVALEWPENLDAQMIDGRLQLTFTRRLSAPMDLQSKQAEVAFYESTYFFAFSITQPPELIGDPGNCTAEVQPFRPEGELAELQAALAQLAREDTPAMENVGALLADRIVLQCA